MTQNKNQANENPKQLSLIDSETRYRRLFETAQDGILILEGNTGEITDVNPFLLKMLGYSYGELLGKQLWEIGFFKDIEASRIAFQELEQKGYIRYEDLPLKTKDGQSRDVEFVSNVYQVDHKRVIQCNIRDITERKRADEEIVRMAKFPAENPNPVLRVAHDGTLIYVNEASQKILAEWNVKIGERAPKFWRDIVTEALKKQTTSIVDEQCSGRNYSFFVTPVMDTNYVNLYGRDETERKVAEEALRDSEVRYHSLFENMLEGLAYCRMIFVDGRPQDFIYLDVNSAFETLSGLKHVVGRKVSEVIPGLQDSDPMLFETYGRVALTGKSEVIEIYVKALNDWYQISVYSPQKEYFVAIFEVITKRKHAEEALHESETSFRYLFANNPLPMWVYDLQTLAFLEVNETAIAKYGYSCDEFLKMRITDIRPPENSLRLIENVTKKRPALQFSGEWRHRLKDGTIIKVEIVSHELEFAERKAALIVAQDITERQQTEEKLKKLSSAVEQTADNVFITDREGVIEYVNPAFEQLTGYSKEEAIGKTPRILKSGIHGTKEYEELWATILSGKVLNGVVINRKKNGELYYQVTTISPLRDGQGNITHFVSTGKDNTERMQREREMEAIATVSAALRAAKTLDEMLPLLLDVTLEVMRSTQGAIWLYDPIMDELRTVVTHGWDQETGEHPIPPEKPGEGINGYVFETGEPYIASDFHLDLRLPETVRQWIPLGMGGASIPIRSGDNVIGTFNVNVTLPRELALSDVRLLTTLSEIAGNAIQRTRSHEKTLRDAQRLAALHSIDVSINASEDLEMTLNILLAQVVNLLNVSAADILLFNPHTLTLEYSAGNGFLSRAIEKSKLRLGEGYAGRAARERHTVNAPDLRIVGSEYARKKLLEAEEFIGYYGVPLITKGRVIGVLDIFNRSPLTPDTEWLDFLEALASQAAIAIDSSTLFNDLQRSNVELLLAYDTTIEGWSRAMDLRDHETEGHTQRVTELTVRLARALGMRDEDIVHVRRGALLHDMGKMGIPDGILLKPGPLTDEEWVIMRKHPRYAFDMLSPIEFLKPALDIPYCHHEKWDGAGYPRGLKGEQIPIAARLFAIVDVWDALRSDRPYREAWSEEKVFEHIKALTGTHFDPKVVELFFSMMKENKELEDAGKISKN